MATFFLDAEKAAKSKGASTKSLPELIDEIYQDKKLSEAPHWDDGNKIRDGILKRAPDEGGLSQKLRENITDIFQPLSIRHNGPSVNMT